MSDVSLRNVKKIYDKNVVAVQDFNLEIKDKEFIVLVGSSGCGKSTTLRMIAGLEEITEGEIYIGDKLVNDVAPKDRDIAMVFQNYALYPHMSVYDNMAFGLKLRKTSHSEIDRRVKQAAEILGIEELMDRKPRALSGGQRQRVAIGRAIVREPKVFLMDEPLSNLDAKLRNQMRAELIKLRERVNTTFIYVTHDQTEAMTLGDRIVIMKDGFIQQIGTPENVFNQPANAFVAGFIGSPMMNFFKAQLIRTGDKYRVELYDAKINLSPSREKILLAKNVESVPITLGIRPEHIRLVETVTENSFTAELDVSEMMGSEVYLHALTEDEKLIIRVQTAILPTSVALKLYEKQQLRLAIPEPLIHLFDADTGENMCLPEVNNGTGGN